MLTVHEDKVVYGPVRRRYNPDQSWTTKEKIRVSYEPFQTLCHLPSVTTLIPIPLNRTFTVRRVELEVIRILNDDHVPTRRARAVDGAIQAEGPLRATVESLPGLHVVVAHGHIERRPAVLEHTFGEGFADGGSDVLCITEESLVLGGNGGKETTYAGADFPAVVKDVTDGRLLRERRQGSNAARELSQSER